MDALPTIAAVSLAMFAHEVSIVLFIVIAILYFSREEKVWTARRRPLYAVLADEFWIRYRTACAGQNGWRDFRSGMAHRASAAGIERDRSLL